MCLESLHDQSRKVNIKPKDYSNAMKKKKNNKKREKKELNIEFEEASNHKTYTI